MERKRKHTEPLQNAAVEAKKTKSTLDEYTVKFARKVERYQKNEPVTISKYYLDKAIEKISNHGTKNKRKHPMIERYGDGGVRSFNNCNSSSLDAVSRSLLQPVVYTPTWTLLVKMFRKTLLAHRWSYCLKLYDALLKYGALRRRHLLYLLRIVFLLLFNLNVPAEKLNNFLTVTLSIRSVEEQSAFLRSLIELKEFSSEASSKKMNIPTKELDDLSEEEGKVFSDTVNAK